MANERGTGKALLAEDADQVAYEESRLFHLLNYVRERRGWLLITAARHPDHWGLKTADVLSRLRLAPTVSIEAPDADLIHAVMMKLFADRQIKVEPDVITFATLHTDRSLDAVRRFVAAVDDDALAEGRRITRPLASRTMARLGDVKHSDDDVSTPYGPT